jgi:hypothetical protein
MTLEERIREIIHAIAAEEVEETFSCDLKAGWDCEGSENCTNCLTNRLLAAVKAAGMVEVCENQEMPPVPNYEVAHIVMERDRLLLTPVQDEAGTWTVWKRVKCEKPEGE